MRKYLRNVYCVAILLGFAACSTESDSQTEPATAAEESAPTDRTSAPSDAEVYIISPKDGEVVSSPVTIQFGLRGMGVAPAGIEFANTGHHHLLVDAEELPPLDEPMADLAIHFGGGQTETTLDLEPGEHTLQLVLGDRSHIAHDPPVISEPVTIVVQ